MPRKAPKEVIEHRITFGDYERNEIKQLVDYYQVDKVAENVPNFIIGGAAVVASGAALLAAYGLYRWFELPPIGEIISDATENFDRFMRPYAYDDLENTVVGPESYRGSITAFMEYTYRYTTQINQGNWTANKPYAIQTANADLDSRLGKLQGQLEVAQKWAESDDWMKRPLGKKLIPALEVKISNFEIERAYILFCLENVQWTIGSNTSNSRTNTQAHVPPNQWYEAGYNWPPPNAAEKLF